MESILTLDEGLNCNGAENGTLHTNMFSDCAASFLPCCAIVSTAGRVVLPVALLTKSRRPRHVCDLQFVNTPCFSALA